MKPAFPKVSIVIPAYNRGSLIRETIDSVLGQNYPNKEVIVIDDGSQDNTRDVVLSFGSSIRYIYQKNSGVSSARNNGISHAEGEYLLFIDADDLMGENVIEQAVFVLEREITYDAIYGLISHFRTDLNNRRNIVSTNDRPKISGDILPELIVGFNLTPGQYMIRKKCIDQSGKFIERLAYGEDWEFALRMADRYQFYFHPVVFLNRRIHPGMATMAKNKTDIVELRLKIFRDLFQNRAFELERKYLTKSVIADWYRSFGFDYVEAGIFQEGRQYLLKSLKTWIWQPKLYLWFIVNSMKKIYAFRKKGAEI